MRATTAVHEAPSSVVGSFPGAGSMDLTQLRGTGQGGADPPRWILRQRSNLRLLLCGNGGALGWAHHRVLIFFFHSINRGGDITGSECLVNRILVLEVVRKNASEHKATLSGLTLTNRSKYSLDLHE